MTGRSTWELADEYVLGLLDPEEAAQLDARLTAEPELAEAVARARDRFAELDLAEPEIAPEPGGWERISARLDAQEPAPTFAAAQRVANDNVSRVWKRLAQAGLAACLVLGVALAWSLGRDTQAPHLVAVLLDETGEPQALIEAYANDRVTVRPLERINVPAGRTLQVWTLPATPGAKPVSLGILTEAGSRVLRGFDLPAPAPGQLYEITIEQSGGSPTGLPTGPIVGKGFAKEPI